MSRSYGECVGCNTALMWVKNLSNVDENIKARVLHRMEYEFDKGIPVAPTFHKGKYGSRYDHYTCGNCGSTISEVHWKFCPDCGFMIAKNDLQIKTRKEFEDIVQAS